MSAATPNVDDRGAVVRIGDALRGTGFTTEAVVAALGQEALSTGRSKLAVFERRVPTGALGTAIRLFFLGLPTDASDAAQLVKLEDIEATGLADVDGGVVVPRGRVAPHGSLLVASDKR